MFIDTHAHMWWPSFDEDRDQVVARAEAAGVKKMIAPGTDLRTSKLAVEMAQKYPGKIFAAVGIHPEESIVTDQDSPGLANSSTKHHDLHRDLLSRRVLSLAGEISGLRNLIRENREWIVAVGEIGTDANTEELRAAMPQQQDLFREQIEIANEFELPVIVHTRNSLAETLEVIDHMRVVPKGQFHCFSNDEAGLTEVLKRGFWVSFGGNITWSKRVRRLVELVPDGKLLLETDSPLMMPRDPKGEPLMDNLRNEPINVTMLARLQAELRGQSLKELESQTTANAEVLFGV
jgi:TatD DNase family protein